MRRDPTIFCAFVLGLTACGASKKDVEAAKRSLYDTDFAIVYQAAVEATREIYPNLDDNPGPGKISTAWHQVQFASCSGTGSTCDDMVNQRVIAQSQGLGPGSPGAANMSSPAAAMAGMPTRLAYKRYFIRFEVGVTGGRPWRVKVIGHASEWEPGAAMPVELKGIAKPPWLEPRADTLRAAIYNKIKKFAVPMKEEVEAPPPEEPKTDPKLFEGLPAGAAKLLVTVKDALARRDYTPLRAQLADDLVWSMGGGTGADEAMALWQADPAAFDAMDKALAGCAADGDRRVTCPAGKPAPNTFQLIVELRGDAWKVTSFVRAEQ
jgi:hypothetical protein